MADEDLINKRHRDAIIDGYLAYAGRGGGEICCKGDEKSPCSSCGRYICRHCCYNEMSKEPECTGLDLCRECGKSLTQRLHDFDLRVAGHKHVTGKLVTSDTNEAVEFYACVEPRCYLYMRKIPEATYTMITPKLN